MRGSGRASDAELVPQAFLTNVPAAGDFPFMCLGASEAH